MTSDPVKDVAGLRNVARFVIICFLPDQIKREKGVWWMPRQ